MLKHTRPAMVEADCFLRLQVRHRNAFNKPILLRIGHIGSVRLRLSPLSKQFRTTPRVTFFQINQTPNPVCSKMPKARPLLAPTDQDPPALEITKREGPNSPFGLISCPININYFELLLMAYCGSNEAEI